MYVLRVCEMGCHFGSFAVTRIHYLLYYVNEFIF